jgi:hypothetical protein
MACQNEAFAGRLFPMLPATSKHLNGNWRTLVYAPAPNQPVFFRPRVSAKNPRIPTGLSNPDGSAVGILFWPNPSQIQFVNFRVSGNHIKQATKVSLKDANTAQVILANPRERSNEALTCRVFLRNRNEHMLCQWMRNQGRGWVFLGYLGFVR